MILVWAIALVQLLIWWEIVVWIRSLKWNLKLIISWWTSKYRVLSSNHAWVLRIHLLVFNLSTNLHLSSWSNLITLYHQLWLRVINLDAFENWTVARIVQLRLVGLIGKCLPTWCKHTSLAPLRWYAEWWNHWSNITWISLFGLLHLKHSCLKRCHIFAVLLGTLNCSISIFHTCVVYHFTFSVFSVFFKVIFFEHNDFLLFFTLFVRKMFFLWVWLILILH